MSGLQKGSKGVDSLRPLQEMGFGKNSKFVGSISTNYKIVGLDTTCFELLVTALT